MSYTTIDKTLWSIHEYLMDRYGISQADRFLYPLEWYINTGRASLDFLNRLSKTSRCVVGRILARGGSIDEVIRAIKAKIGYVGYEDMF